MNLRFKKIITIGLATIFSVGASIMAVSAATLPNIPIQNTKFVTEDWYIKQNTHLIRNDKITDLRAVAEITANNGLVVQRNAKRRILRMLCIFWTTSKGNKRALPC